MTIINMSLRIHNTNQNPQGQLGAQNFWAMYEAAKTPATNNTVITPPQNPLTNVTTQPAKKGCGCGRRR